jgi:acetolactate synthase-1/2/3 large subunit
MNVSDYIFRALAAHGVNHVFMLSGGGCMYLCDALGRSGIPHTCCLHEQAATVSALGYAQYANSLGVVLVTTGPGSTNAITGVLGAWSESAPLLVLSGQVKTEDSAELFGVRTRGVQEAPTIEMVKAITKYAATVANASDIRHHLEKAVYLAQDRRPGPVWLDIPLNIQSAEIDEKTLRPFEMPEAESADLGGHATRILKMIEDAQRPVILAGYGIRIDNAVAPFRELLEKLQIPVLTTWKAADIIPASHPLFMGRPGATGQRAANFVQQNADLILCVGARLDFPQTGFNQAWFAREAKKVIVDIDPAELKKFKFAIDLPICASAGGIVQAINAIAPRSAGKGAWLAQCRKWQETYPLVSAEQYKSEKGFVDLYVFIETLSSLLAETDVVVPGSSGMGSDVSYQTASIKEGQRMLNSPGIGSMGFGIPSALGACIASGGKRVICVNGDGGFQMNVQELETVKNHDLPIKFFVLNNRGYASIRNTQRNYFNGFYVGSSPESGVSLPDVAKQGMAYGIPSFTISSHGEIETVGRKVLECEGPAICEVFTDPDASLYFRASSFIRSDGSAVSRPIEDLYPFLPRKEFYANMHITPLNKTGVNICNIIFSLDGAIHAGMDGVLAALAKEYDLYGIASATRDATEDAENIRRHFVEVKSGDAPLPNRNIDVNIDVGAWLIERLIAENNLDPARTVIVSSRPSDVRAAREKGIQGIALNCGHEPQKNFRGEASLVAESADELLDILI